MKRLKNNLLRGFALLLVAVFALPAASARAESAATAANEAQFIQYVNDTTTSKIILTADIAVTANGEWGYAGLEKTITGPGKTLALPGNLSLAGALVFEDLTLDFTGTSLVAANWNRLTFGAGVQTEYKPGAFPKIFGGRLLQNEDENAGDSAGIVIHSGNFPTQVVGGSMSGPGQTAGNILVAMTGGSVGSISACGARSHSGSAEIRLTGGSAGRVYGAGPSNAVAAAVVGDIKIVIGGTATVGAANEVAVVAGATNASVAGNTEIIITGSATVGSSGNPGVVYGGALVNTGDLYAQSGNTHVTISESPTLYADIFGGGANAAAAAANVTVSGSPVINGNIYGGGAGAGAETAETSVSVSGGTIAGNVFGGGQSSPVSGTAAVSISGGEIAGSVFSGGAAGARPANVGTSNVTITSGAIGGDVVAENGGEKTEETKATITLQSIGADDPFASFVGTITDSGGENAVRLEVVDCAFTYKGAISLAKNGAVDIKGSSSFALGAMPEYAAETISVFKGAALAITETTLLQCATLNNRGSVVTLSGNGYATLQLGSSYRSLVGDSSVQIRVGSSGSDYLHIAQFADGFAGNTTIVPVFAADYDGARVDIIEAEFQNTAARKATHGGLFVMEPVAVSTRGFTGVVELQNEVRNGRIVWYLVGTAQPTFTVTVVNGTIAGTGETSGQFAPGELVSITANTIGGRVFSGWSSAQAIGLGDPLARQQGFAMIAGDVTVTAAYTETSLPPTGDASPLLQRAVIVAVSAAAIYLLLWVRRRVERAKHQ